MSAIVNQVEFENQVVGQAIQHDDLSAFVSLAPDCFLDEKNRAIHEAICGLVSDGTSVDIVTVFERVNALKPGLETIDSIVDRTNNWLAVSWFPKLCGRLEAAYRHRKVLDAIGKAFRDAQDATDASEAKQTAIGRIMALEDVSPAQHLFTGRESVKLVLEEAKTNFAKPPEERKLPFGVSTGFRQLDRLTRGWQPGCFYIIGAGTGRGKTVFGLNCARHAAFAGKKVLYVSLEMKHTDLIRRIVSAESAIRPDIIQSGDLTADQIDNLVNTMNRVEGYLDNITIFDQQGISLFRLAAIIRQMSAVSDVDLVVIDYLQLLEVDGKHQSREREVATLSKSLVAIARANDIAILALSQLNQVGQIRESQAVKHDATGVIKIEYEEGAWTQDGGDVEAIINVDKNRRGEEGRFPVMFQRCYQRFVE